MIAEVGRLTGKPGFFWHFHLEKLQSYCLCLTLVLKSEGEKRKMPPKYQVQSKFQGTENAMLCLQSQSWGHHLKQILQTSEYEIWLVVHLLKFCFGFGFFLLLSFSLAFIGESKQGYSFGGAMEEVTHMIIHNKSVAAPTLEEIHVCKNDQLVLRRHCWIWLNLLKNLKAVPSLKRLIFDHLP